MKLNRCYDCGDDGLVVAESFLDEHEGHDVRVETVYQPKQPTVFADIGIKRNGGHISERIQGATLTLTPRIGIGGGIIIDVFEVDSTGRPVNPGTSASIHLSMVQVEELIVRLREEAMA